MKTMQNIQQKLQDLEKTISYNFLDKSILQAAITHSSYINEHHTLKQNSLHNERLEFLGDAILELLISEELFVRYPDQREGLLTHSRSSLVNENTLAKIALKIKLDEVLLLGKGEEGQDGRKKTSILSDAFEALLAAIYLDAQNNSLYSNPLQPAKKLINTLYKSLWADTLKPKLTKDFKTLLQEYTQHHFKETPKYALLECLGPEHKKVFKVEVTLPNNKSITESGNSKKSAEQLAAQKALELFNNTPI